MQTIKNINNTIATNPAVIVYFPAPTCHVCDMLKPKLMQAIYCAYKLQYAVCGWKLFS